jgi:hypothetical protein
LPSNVDVVITIGESAEEVMGFAEPRADTIVPSFNDFFIIDRYESFAEIQVAFRAEAHRHWRREVLALYPRT